jgi:hypothetical protein
MYIKCIQYKKNRKYQNGFSLAGTLISVAIVAALALTIASIISNGLSGQKSIQNSIDFNIFRSNIQKVIDNKVLCKGAFQTYSATPSAPANATFINSLDAQTIGQIMIGTTVLAKNNLEIAPGLKISKIEMKAILPTGAALPADTATIAGKNIYHVALTIEVTKVNGGLGGSTLSNQKNPFILTIQTDATDKIEDCSVNQLPVCAAGELLEAKGDGSFVCSAAPKLPSCTAGQSVTSNGAGTYYCYTPYSRSGEKVPVGGFMTYAKNKKNLGSRNSWGVATGLGGNCPNDSTSQIVGFAEDLIANGEFTENKTNLVNACNGTCHVTTYLCLK